MSTEITESVEAPQSPAAAAPKPARPRSSRAKSTAGKAAPPRPPSARAKSPQQGVSALEMLEAAAGVPGAGTQPEPFIGGTSPKALEAVASEPEAGMKIKMVFEDGEWVEKLVPVYNPADTIELINDPRSVTLGDISLQWESLGRGHMAWAWVHRDAKYSSRERSMGYGRVNPAKVKLDGYSVQDVPGVGKCYVLSDVILMEMPKERADQYKAITDRDILDEQQARARGIEQQDKAMEAQGEGLVKISRESDQQWETFGNPIAQEHAALARGVQHMQKLSGSRHFGQDIGL